MTNPSMNVVGGRFGVETQDFSDITELEEQGKVKEGEGVMVSAGNFGDGRNIVPQQKQPGKKPTVSQYLMAKGTAFKVWFMKVMKQPTAVASMVIKIVTFPLWLLDFLKGKLMVLLMGEGKTWGEWKVGDDEHRFHKTTHGRFQEYFKDHHGRAYWYGAWLPVNLFTQAVLIKVIADPVLNAKAV